MASEIPDEEIPYQLAVVHVEPLGGGDEGAQISGACLEDGGEKEVDMKPGELARPIAVAAASRVSHRFQHRSS